jgi:hypothetical protein
MPASVANLWPADFGQEQMLAPVAVLRQQAAALGERTQNIVIGKVSTSGNGQRFSHILYLYCPPLGYQVELLAVQHGIDFYPATISVYQETGTSPPESATDPEDFSRKLGQIFASERVKRIVRSLLAQSKQ